MKNKRSMFALFGVVLLTLSSCANYQASSLNNLCSEVMYSPTTDEKVIVVAKAFNKTDCKKYLDRDVISAGYQPVQIYIQNNSDINYHFSLDRVDLSYVESDEVAKKVHTSTLGRVTVYGLGSLILTPLIIPAIVDGVKSSRANDSLDYDFASKAAKDQIIYPHAHLNKLLFVPVSNYHQNFNVVLVDQQSKIPKTFHVVAD